jgi:hypothetical protein
VWIGTKPVHIGDDHLDNINHTAYKVRKTLIGKQKGKSPHFEYIIQYLDRVTPFQSNYHKRAFHFLTCSDIVIILMYLRYLFVSTANINSFSSDKNTSLQLDY